MSFSDVSKSKDYRVWYFIFIVINIVGMLFCLFLFRYTDYFDTDFLEIGSFSLLSKKDLLDRFTSEIAVLSIVFVSGFTVFSLPFGVLFSLFRGFMCGYCALTLALLYKNSTIKLSYCIIILIITTVIPALECCVCAKARCFSLQNYDKPFNAKEIFFSKRGFIYTETFLFIGFLIFTLIFLTAILK